MERLGAPEHVVRGALDEMERQGKIIRRVGRGGSIVAELPARLEEQVLGPALGGTPREVIPGDETGPEPFSQSVIAIGEPDGGVFDQAMRVLMKQAKSAKVVVHCRFMQSDGMEQFEVPSLQAGPRKFVVFRQHFLPLAERLHAAGHRVVFVGTPHIETCIEMPSVAGDQEHGGYLAVNHLLELGHRRFAFHFGNNYSQLRRWAGCRRAIEEARESGLEAHAEMLDWSNVWDWKREPQLIRDYFARPDAPTGIVSWNDDSAVELLTLLLFNGIRVPDDVSLIGYDNLPRSAAVYPALTTVDGVLSTQIQAALRLLTLPKFPTSQQILVVPTLVPRDSTAAIGNERRS
jgi:DNA-binding LacI/PurR family transcriptional regulator